MRKRCPLKGSKYFFLLVSVAEKKRNLNFAFLYSLINTNDAIEV